MKIPHLAALSTMATLSFCLGFALPMQATATASPPPAPATTAAPSGAAEDAPAAASTSPDPVGAAVGQPTEATPPAAEIPDPELEPAGYVAAFMAWWRGGGKVPAVLVLAIGLVHVAGRRIKWLQVGWRRAAVTLGLVGMSTLLDTWLSTGAAGNLTLWLLGGASAVVAYLAKGAPVPAPVPAKTATP